MFRDCMSYEQIRCRRDGACATITFDRPEKLNAFTFRMLAEIEGAMDEVDDPDLRAIVFIGAGRAFSAGDDLVDMGGTDPANDIRNGHHRLILRLRRLRVPVIAALNGYTLGAASDLALAADFGIAAADAELGDVRTKQALCSMSGAAYWLLRMVGVARATEILLLGERIPAARALELGIVSRVVPADRLEAEVAAFVTHLESLPTAALGAQKACLEFGLRHDVPAVLENEMHELVDGFQREDWREATRAFVERRAPRFSGR